MRPIDHSRGSHGTPGIYFKYDLSALKVEVTQDRYLSKDFWLLVLGWGLIVITSLGSCRRSKTSRPGFIQFLVRLCAGVGGLVATSTIVSNLIKNMVDFYCCKR